MEDLTQGWRQLGPFSQNQVIFLIFKKVLGRPPPSPLVVCLMLFIVENILASP